MQQRAVKRATASDQKGEVSPVRPLPAIRSPGHPLVQLQRIIGNQAVLRLLQARAVQPKLAVGQPGDPYEQEADRIAHSMEQRDQPELVSSSAYARPTGSLRLQRQPRPGLPPRPPIPSRGPNPASCISPLCGRYTRPPIPSNDTAARRRATDWLHDALSCLRSNAAASNASHAADIAANEESELQAEVQQLNQDLTSQLPPAGRYRYFLQNLEDLCRRRQREIEIEFRYNVVFENPAGALQWGFFPAEWDTVEGALAALPAEATWANPQLLHFRREACHPGDVDPQTGACVGQPAGTGRGFVGGETEVRTGEIRVFTPGLGTQPYGRSARLGLPATAQTIRHEVGHVVASQIPTADKEDFFENIVRWHEYPWAWVRTQPSPYPNWKVERDRLRAELGLNDAQFDAWLDNLVLSLPVVQAPRTYIKVPVAAGASSYFVRAFDTAEVPAGVEFDYARTDQGEYLAELYALAVSRPEFLHSALPPAQTAWLKRVVFRVPENLEELARHTAFAEPLQAQFLIRGSRLFSWEQLDALLSELLVQYQQAGARLG